MTGTDAVNAALKLCGLRIPTTAQQEEALATLNRMLGLWSANPLRTFPHVVEENLALVAGTATYTIGSGGAFNTVRPIRIATAFLRDSANVDYPLDPTMSREDYALIADKVSQRRPDRIYYAPEYPLGKLHFDAPPDAAYTLRLYAWKPLTAIATLGTTVTLPGEYEKTLIFALAVDLAPTYNVALDATVVQQAIGALVTLENLNRQPTPYARHDPAITRVLWR